MEEIYRKALRDFNRLLKKLETCQAHEKARYEKRLTQVKRDLEDLEEFMYIGNNKDY